jgi:hypothetical protein
MPRVGSCPRFNGPPVLFGHAGCSCLRYRARAAPTHCCHAPQYLGAELTEPASCGTATPQMGAPRMSSVRAPAARCFRARLVQSQRSHCSFRKPLRAPSHGSPQPDRKPVGRCYRSQTHPPIFAPAPPYCRRHHRTAALGRADTRFSKVSASLRGARGRTRHSIERGRSEPGPASSRPPRAVTSIPEIEKRAATPSNSRFGRLARAQFGVDQLHASKAMRVVRLYATGLKSTAPQVGSRWWSWRRRRCRHRCANRLRRRCSLANPSPRPRSAAPGDG